MENSIYGYSLCSAMALMLFFGLYFIFGRMPDKSAFSNYLRSRKVIGFALLILSANYAVHFFTGIRFINHSAAIVMNMSTYFLCYWLFSSSLRQLLDSKYFTKPRFVLNISLWLFFTAISSTVIMIFPEGILRNTGLSVMAIWLFVYGIRLAYCLISEYRRSVKLIDDTHSDDVAAYINWLSIFTYWAVIFGVGCGLLTFLPDKYIFIWILSSIPFYIYLFCSYMNYLLFYEKVEKVSAKMYTRYI